MKKEEMATQQASESFVKSEENDDELTEEDEAEEGEELHRFTIQALSKLLSESARFSGGCATDRVHGVVEALQKMYDDGMNYENQVRFIAHIEVDFRVFSFYCTLIFLINICVYKLYCIIFRQNYFWMSARASDGSGPTSSGVIFGKSIGLTHVI